MPRKNFALGPKRVGTLLKPMLTMVLMLLLISLLAACSTPAAITQPPTSNEPATTKATPTTTTSSGSAKPQGELRAALATFGNENFLPWIGDNGASQLNDIVYDVLVYWDEVNHKFIPGLAESWEASPDAMTLTYHLRKGIQWQEGWGELTAEDIKYNFEKQGSPDSMNKTNVQNIKSMDVPDPYTLVVHFKKAAPTFLGIFSFGFGGICQGFVCKKYVESVGNTIASQKPIGTGPYRLADSQLGSYYKFEALDSHWRVVPEFKTLTVRLVPEISTTVAMLKNKEIDLASVPAEQLVDLKTAGLGTEIYGGGVNLIVQWGGIAIPEDGRYDPTYHNKDPWTDIRIRKAMTIAVDRQAICKTIYAGGAAPIGVFLFSSDTDKYQYPYDPAAARQLLAEAGYPNGFSFRVISSVNPGLPETPRVVEALAGYWQQIGLDPKIAVIDYNTYSAQRREFKTAGDIALFKYATTSDMLDKANLVITADCPVPLFQDEESYNMWKDGNAKVDSNERLKYVDKLNQYFYENYGPMPVINIGSSWAWNSDRTSPWPHSATASPTYFEYVRHAQPLNTFRLFTPCPDR